MIVAALSSEFYKWLNVSNIDISSSLLFQSKRTSDLWFTREVIPCEEETIEYTPTDINTKIQEMRDFAVKYLSITESEKALINFALVPAHLQTYAGGASNPYGRISITVSDKLVKDGAESKLAGVIFHEYVHARQMLDRLLYCGIDHITWKGRYISYETYRRDYHSFEFEKEAYRNSAHMVLEYYGSEEPGYLLDTNKTEYYINKPHISTDLDVMETRPTHHISKIQLSTLKGKQHGKYSKHR